MAGAEVVIPVDFGEVGADGRHSLHADKDVDLPVFFGLDHLIVSMHDPEILTLRDFSPRAVHDLLGPGGIIPIIGGIDPDHKDAPLHASFPEAFQMVFVKNIRLALESAVRHIAPDIRVCIKIHGRYAHAY